MTTRLFVSNLDKGITENDLHGLFNKSGLVMSVGITHSPASSSTNSGYVDMSSDESAGLAASKLSGTSLAGREMIITVAK